MISVHQITDMALKEVEGHIDKQKWLQVFSQHYPFTYTAYLQLCEQWGHTMNALYALSQEGGVSETEVCCCLMTGLIDNIHVDVGYLQTDANVCLYLRRCNYTYGHGMIEDKLSTVCLWGYCQSALFILNTFQPHKEHMAEIIVDIIYGPRVNTQSLTELIEYAHNKYGILEMPYTHWSVYMHLAYVHPHIAILYKQYVAMVDVGLVEMWVQQDPTSSRMVGWTQLLQATATTYESQETSDSTVDKQQLSTPPDRPDAEPTIITV